MSSKPIVLVTGGTGFVGSHVIHQLLEQNQYIVRATARQAQRLLGIFPNAGSNLEVVEVPSLTADHSEALRGVQAVIHVAAPIYTNGDSGKQILDGAYHGSLNVVKAAIDAGIKKIIVTGTIANLFGPDFKAAFGSESLTEHSFGPATSESDIDVEKDSLASIYQKAKTLAEKKVWELARENPDVDVTVTIPPMILGPFAPNYPIPANRQGLGSLDFLYEMIVGSPNGPNTYPGVPLGHLIDVRDVAKTHILSLAIPPTRDSTDKRFLTASKIFTWEEVNRVLRRERPGLVPRLPAEGDTAIAQTSAPYDTSLTERVLGFKAADYVPWEQTILDSIDELTRWEERVNA